MRIMIAFLSRSILALTCLVGVTNLCQADHNLSITIDAGNHDRETSLVRADITLPKEVVGKAKEIYATVHVKGQPFIRGQITRPRLLSKKNQKDAYELYFFLPKLMKGKSFNAKVSVFTSANSKLDEPLFSWNDTPGKHLQLRLGQRPVLQYMYEKLNTSSKTRIGETYKVYHHVYDIQGKRLLTKGPGGLFPHHRGLFYGFNRITYGKNKKADIWHCKNGVHQAHSKVISSEAGPLVGRHLIEINWNDKNGKPFARELRELTAYTTKKGTLIEFASKLTSLVDNLKLDGDPQHAGFQFRATQDVPDKTKALTYYIRPDGKGTPGSFRNWPKQKGHRNLQFNALCMVVDKQRYTIAYLDSPKNPKPARFSERDYGRFGSYFATKVPKDKPLKLNYRVWLQEGEMKVKQVAAKSFDFINPVAVKVNESTRPAASRTSKKKSPDNTPPKGFKALFNGKDLTGWKGLVANPEKRAKMSKEELAKAQKKADASMRAHWKVVDGVFVFDGKGQSLCTAKDYGDFEMYVDWKILAKGDSGIYLRGSPQVQIWDPALRNIGSGGLFNNKKNPSKPLKMADNPVGTWNTFKIKMVGEKVIIHLNGQLVVDNVVLENYWDHKNPIYSTGQIELQNHGNTLYFKNIYIREIKSL